MKYLHVTEKRCNFAKLTKYKHKKAKHEND